MWVIKILVAGDQHIFVGCHKYMIFEGQKRFFQDINSDVGEINKFGAFYQSPCIPDLLMSPSVKDFWMLISLVYLRLVAIVYL